MSRHIFQKIIDFCRGRHKLDVKISKLAFGDKCIYEKDDALDKISEAICGDKPVLIARFGTVELETVRQFLRNKDKKIIFDPYQKQCISDFAGFFPTDDYHLVRFASEHIEVVKQLDILGVRKEKFEEEMCIKYLPDDAKIINISATDGPMFSAKSWTRHLKGKKVLVIHPFEELIKKQYEKRELLFKNPDVLPEFELITFKAVQGICDSKKELPYSTWFEALEDMKSKISKIDFDIALIGAGAYGMFLGAHCKAIGKKAVHMGGATQLLFGIKGNRWDKYNLYNEHWIRPSAAETPEGVERLEGGTFAYW